MADPAAIAISIDCRQWYCHFLKEWKCVIACRNFSDGCQSTSIRLQGLMGIQTFYLRQPFYVPSEKSPAGMQVLDNYKYVAR